MISSKVILRQSGLSFVTPNELDTGVTRTGTISIALDSAYR